MTSAAHREFQPGDVREESQAGDMFESAEHAGEGDICVGCSPGMRTSLASVCAARAGGDLALQFP